MIVHGRVRATRDVDIFIAVDETNIELLKTALRSLFDDPSIEEITATDLAGDYPVIRYVSPDGSLVVDERRSWSDDDAWDLVNRLAHVIRDATDGGRRRVAVFAEHFDAVGTSLGRAVGAYNQALGSMERRLLVTARRFSDLGAGSTRSLPVRRVLEEVPSAPAAVELVGDSRRDGIAPAG